MHTAHVILRLLAWGNSTYFIRVFLRSQIRFQTHFRISRPLSLCDSFSATRLTLFSSSSESNPVRFRTALRRFTRRVPASRQPDLPYQARVEVNSLDLDPSPARRHGPRHLSSCSERAGPEAAWLWWVSPRVGRCSESLLAASRTPRGSENITRRGPRGVKSLRGCDRASRRLRRGRAVHGADRSLAAPDDDVAPVQQVARRRAVRRDR